MKITFNQKEIDRIAENIAKVKLTTAYEMKTKFKEASEIMKNDVVDTITIGNSPVQGSRRFVDYSLRYKKQISAGRYTSFGKLLRPVNLKLSGRMLESIASKATKNGFVVWFTNKLARIHSLEGPGGRRDKMRKVAPYGSEKWKPSVYRNARDFLTKEATKKIISKLRRL